MTASQILNSVVEYGDCNFDCGEYDAQTERFQDSMKEADRIYGKLLAELENLDSAIQKIIAISSNGHTKDQCLSCAKIHEIASGLLKDDNKLHINLNISSKTTVTPNSGAVKSRTPPATVMNSPCPIATPH